MSGLITSNLNIPTLEELKKEAEENNQFNIEDELSAKREEEIENQVVRYLQIAKGIQRQQSVGINGLADSVIGIAQMVQIQNIYGE